MKKLRHGEVKKFACGPKNYEATQTAHPDSQVLGSRLQPHHVINKHHSVQETLGTKFRFLPESYKFWNPNPWEFHLASSVVTTLTTPLTHHMSSYVWLRVLGFCFSFCWEHPTLKPLLALKSHYLCLSSNVKPQRGCPTSKPSFYPMFLSSPSSYSVPLMVFISIQTRFIILLPLPHSQISNGKW